MRRETDIDAIRQALRDQGIDGWLFAQFRGRDPIATRVLGLESSGLETRRWFYFVPAEGEPRALVHAIEPSVLDALPGSRRTYRTWKELDEGIAELLGSAERVAMQYSPRNRIPYVSTVDAGTVEAVRAAGAEVVSSGDLVQEFTAALSDAQIESHRQAAETLPKLVRGAFGRVRESLAEGGSIDEHRLQAHLLERLSEAGLETVDAPIVAINANSADPHYAPSASGSEPIREGDVLLIDCWARRPVVGSVFGDITWMAYVGERVPDPVAEVFDVVRRARDAAIDLIVARYTADEPVRGFEADRAARKVLVDEGYGDSIRHRTGHSITDELHGTGANLDDFETHDERLLLRRTCFSVEPAVYLEEFGMRSEVNMMIPPKGRPEVTTRLQHEVLPILASDVDL